MAPAGEREDVGERVQRLASLWRAVTSRPVHPVGCTCMGHFLIPAMNARDMEADILDYMRGRHAAEGIDALVALLDAREAEREATDMPPPPAPGCCACRGRGWRATPSTASSPTCSPPWSPSRRTAAPRGPGAA